MPSFPSIPTQCYVSLFLLLCLACLCPIIYTLLHCPCILPLCVPWRRGGGERAASLGPSLPAFAFPLPTHDLWLFVCHALHLFHTCPHFTLPCGKDDWETCPLPLPFLPLPCLPCHTHFVGRGNACHHCLPLTTLHTPACWEEERAHTHTHTLCPICLFTPFPFALTHTHLYRGLGRELHPSLPIICCPSYPTLTHPFPLKYSSSSPGLASQTCLAVRGVCPCPSFPSCGSYHLVLYLTCYQCTPCPCPLPLPWEEERRPLPHATALLLPHPFPYTCHCPLPVPCPMPLPTCRGEERRVVILGTPLPSQEEYTFDLQFTHHCDICNHLLPFTHAFYYLCISPPLPSPVPHRLPVPRPCPCAQVTFLWEFATPSPASFISPPAFAVLPLHTHTVSLGLVLPCWLCVCLCLCPTTTPTPLLPACLWGWRCPHA